MTKQRVTRKDAGELIFDVLADHLDTGLSQSQIRAETGLTRKQFVAGKEYLREELCSNKEFPYSYDPTDNVYKLNVNLEPVEDYWLMRMKITAKQLRRLLDGSISPAKSKFGGKKIGRLHRHVDNLILDLEDVIAGV